MEIIKGKTSSIPIYDAGGGRYIAAYYAEGKRRMIKYKSLEAAKAGAKEIIQTLRTGVAHAAAFSPKETASINEAVDILKAGFFPRLVLKIKQLVGANKSKEWHAAPDSSQTIGRELWRGMKQASTGTCG